VKTKREGKRKEDEEGVKQLFETGVHTHRRTRTRRRRTRVTQGGLRRFTYRINLPAHTHRMDHPLGWQECTGSGGVAHKGTAV
jgi:hypothetical protein